MGRSHGNEQTYPRLADVIGFFTPDKLVDVAKAVLTIHRDFGDRTDRKHARLKYVVAERGVDWTRAEIEKRAGLKLAAGEAFQIHDDRRPLRLAQGRGRKLVSRAVRRDRPRQGRGRPRMKTALRQVAEKFPGIEFRLSANQNVILANVAEADKAGINAILAAARREDRKPGAACCTRLRWPAPRCPPAASRWRNPSACCPA